MLSLAAQIKDARAAAARAEQVAEQKAQLAREAGEEAQRLEGALAAHGAHLDEASRGAQLRVSRRCRCIFVVRRGVGSLFEGRRRWRFAMWKGFVRGLPALGGGGEGEAGDGALRGGVRLDDRTFGYVTYDL